jgi:hypothetical protein
MRKYFGRLGNVHGGSSARKASQVQRRKRSGSSALRMCRFGDTSSVSGTRILMILHGSRTSRSPGLHPCPLTVDRSVFERCSSQFEVSGVPPSPRGSCRFLVSSDRRSERLEPYEGKLSRTVLRGLGGSNPARPLDLGGVGLARNWHAVRRPVRAAAERRPHERGRSGAKRRQATTRPPRGLGP